MRLEEYLINFLEGKALFYGFWKHVAQVAILFGEIQVKLVQQKKLFLVNNKDI